MSQLGQSLKQKRVDKGITVEELSKSTKISPAIIRDIEDGKFDRYEGDEAYVKMYLKKISNALELDANDVTQQYVALTEEIQLAKLQEQIKQQEELPQEKKKINLDLKIPKLNKGNSVYQDKSHLTIVRSVIVLIIICLLIFVFWYGFYSTRQTTETPEFQPTQETQVEGEVGTDETTNTTDPTDTSTDTTQSTNAGVTFTRNDTLDFEFELPEGTTEFTFKIEFMTRSWAKLLVNGSDYSEFKSQIYHNNDTEEPDTVELTFTVSEFRTLRLRNGCSLDHRYYINGQQVPLTEDDSFERPSNFNLSLKS